VTLQELVSENIYSVGFLLLSFFLSTFYSHQATLFDPQEMKNVINRRERDGQRIRWQSESFERPKVVNVRLASDEAQGIDLVQVTVRLRHRQVRISLSLVIDLLWAENP